jgi:hypothetical protein
MFEETGQQGAWRTASKAAIGKGQIKRSYLIKIASHYHFRDVRGSRMRGLSEDTAAAWPMSAY